MSNIIYQKTDPPVFTTTLPLPPQVVIIDAMFVINTRPLRQTRMFSDYACFLFEQFVTQHFRDGVQEVQLVFDKPGRQSFNPKQYKHKKRYLQCNNDHRHCSFTPITNILNNWQEHLQYPQCKRSVIEAIGLSLLQKGCCLLKSHQRLVLAGCFSGLNENNTWLLHAGEVSAEQPTEYYSNAEEADSRI